MSGTIATRAFVSPALGFSGMSTTAWSPMRRPNGSPSP